MPQRVSKMESNIEVDPRPRGFDDRMRHLPPALRLREGALTAGSLTDRIAPPLTNRWGGDTPSLFAPNQAWPPRAITRDSVAGERDATRQRRAEQRAREPDPAWERRRVARRLEAQQQNTVRNELNIRPMLADHNVQTYVRNSMQAEPPMQAEMGRQGAAAAMRLS